MDRLPPLLLSALVAVFALGGLMFANVQPAWVPWEWAAPGLSLAAIALSAWLLWALLASPSRPRGRRRQGGPILAAMLALLMVAPPLTACAALPKLPDFNKPLVGATLADKQALLGAEVAFKGVTAAINAGIDNGLLKGTQAGQVQVIYRKGKQALDAARDAQGLGRAESIGDKARSAKKLFDDAWALIGKASPS